MSYQINRRQLLKQGSVVAGALAFGVHSFPVQGQESRSPNEKLNLAAIGTANRAGANIAGVASQNIIAICDVDDNLIEQGVKRAPSARRYRDFRVLLEKEAEKLDGVVVSTADHTHAPAAAMAMRLGKHVYCEKPLTHTVYEARVLANLAKEKNLVTQMGTQIHAGDNYRRVVELVQFGAIGDIDEVHVWVSSGYSGAKFTTGAPVPAGLDWDLWLGPATERPYSEGVHPFHWRRFWEYGAGSFSDLACHYMDLPHWALDLRAPTKVSAQGPAVDPVSAPEWCIANYEYPARGNKPAVKLTWYDGGKQPERLKEIKGDDGAPIRWNSGQLFVGKEGMILSDYSRNILLPREKFADFKRPEQSIPKSIGHHNEWIEAVKTGGPTTCNFDYSGALTEAVLLGVVAFRSGDEILWDAENLKVTNSERAQNLIHKEYRKGWTL